MALKSQKRGQKSAFRGAAASDREHAAQQAPMTTTPGTIEDYQRKKRQRLILLSITLCMAILFSVIMLFIRGAQLPMDRLRAWLPFQSVENAASPPQEPVMHQTRRLAMQRIRLAPRMLSSPPLLEMASFIRQFPLRGRDFCAALKAIGLDSNAWGESQADQATFECMAEKDAPIQAGDQTSASVFVLVRGDPSGHIVQVRLKVVEAEKSPAIASAYRKTLTKLVELTHWWDMNDTLKRLQLYQNTDENHFGIGVKLSSEFTGENRHNIMFLLEDDTELQRQTRAFLSARPSFKDARPVLPLWPKQRF